MEQPIMEFGTGDGAHAQDFAFVVVPYVQGKLRAETRAAVESWGGHYTFQQIDQDNDYAYASAFLGWWNVPAETIVIEQDVVPAPGQILDMLACERPWCVRPYHVGEGRFTTGLGFCKFSVQLKRTFTSVGYLASRDPRGKGLGVHWKSLNESIDRQLTRYGVIPHVHRPAVEHLHYPAVPDGA